MLKATHSRKARRPGRCPLCCGPIRVGERITRVGRAGAWVHGRCFLARYRPTLNRKDIP